MSKNNDFDKKLDFIVNLLFDILCRVDVHYQYELLGYLMGEAEQLGFNIEPSKTWNYNKEDYKSAKELDVFMEKYERNQIK